MKPVRRLIALVAAFAVLLAACASAAQAAFPGFNGKIAFHSSGQSEIDYDIYAASSSGAALQNLTADSPDEDLFAAWSPDGTRIAFQSCPDIEAGPPSPCFFRLYLMDADGGNRTSLGLLGQNPAWSPDGTKLVYVLASSSIGQPGSLRIVNADGTADHEVAPGEIAAGFAAQDPAWSPDGASIAYAGNPEPFVTGPTEIFTIRPDGSGKQRLTLDARTDPGTGADDISSRAPNWAPDGSRIVYGRLSAFTPPVGFDLYTVRPDGTGQTALTGTPEPQEEAPAFSPDGRQIAFESRLQLHTMNSDGTGVNPVPNLVQPSQAPDWQPLSQAPGPVRSDYTNAAAFCKAQREFLGDAEFAALYGTNGNGANAYGKCVTREK